jgi:hypothetical protein
MNKKKIQYIREVEVVDTSTGEIVTKTTDQIIQIPSEPPFIKFYIDDVSHLHNITDTGKNVLFEVLRLMAYGNNEIIIPPAIRKRLAAKLGLSINSFNNQFSKIVSSGIIFKVEDSVYQANPNLFGRGSWKDNYNLRQKSLQLVMQYNQNGSKEIFSSLSENYEERILKQSNSDTNKLT